MKKILFVLFIVFLLLNVHGEIKYKVSGKVLQNGKSVSNFNIRIRGKESNIRQTVIPDKNGYYFFYLPSGKYKIECDHVLMPRTKDEMFIKIVGPDEITVQNKNISRVSFNIYKYTEIIESNRGVLSSISQEIPTVEYRWGRVPLHSEGKCREYAESMKDIVTDDMPSDILAGLKLGEPVVYFDFKNNPIFYEYPVVYTNLNVEVGYFGVEALGIQPSFGMDSIALEIESKNDPNLRRYKKMLPITSDGLIPRVIEKLVQKKNISKKDITVEKLIFTGSTTEVLLKIKSTNELILASFTSLTWHTLDTKNLLFQQEIIEMYSTLQYIVDYKRKMNIPLMKNIQENK